MSTWQKKTDPPIPGQMEAYLTVLAETMCVCYNTTTETAFFHFDYDVVDKPPGFVQTRRGCGFVVHALSWERV